MTAPVQRIAPVPFEDQPGDYCWSCAIGSHLTCNGHLDGEDDMFECGCAKQDHRPDEDDARDGAWDDANLHGEDTR